jgi:hypothetical protein
MWQRIRNLNVSAKTLAGAWVALTALYVENKAFHDFVFRLFSRFPHFLQEFVVGLLIPVLLVFGKWRKAKEASDDAVQRSGTGENERV